MPHKEDGQPADHKKSRDEEMRELMWEFLAAAKELKEIQDKGQADRQLIREESRLARENIQREFERRLTQLEAKVGLAFGTNGAGVHAWERRMGTLEHQAKDREKSDADTQEELKAISARIGKTHALVATVITNIVWIIGQWVFKYWKGP